MNRTVRTDWFCAKARIKNEEDPDNDTRKDYKQAWKTRQSTSKSKETVGNSWTVLKIILGHKYHHNH